jgi:hypothetical protein
MLIAISPSTELARDQHSHTACSKKEMGTRGVTWRRLCPDEVSRRLEAAARVTYYILHETGPTGFILKEDGARKKIKVLLVPYSILGGFPN